MAAIIGESDGAEEYTFGKIASVAADGSGTVYVADGIGSAVMAYDPQGKFLGKLGREGRGPGEFRYIRDLTTVDDRLLVRGAFKTSEFRRRQQSRFADSLIREWSIRGLDSPLASRAKASRHLYITPSYTYRDFLIRGYFYAVFDTLGNVNDTIAVPPMPHPEFSGRANYPVNEQGFGQAVEGVNRSPFEPAPSWDIDVRGHVFFSHGDRYEILEFAPTGDTVNVIRVTSAPRRVPTAAHRDSARSFFSRLDSIPVPLDRMRGMSDLARRREIPRSLPEIQSITVDDAGNLWVRRWPREGKQETLFDVWSSTGERLRVIEIPADLRADPAPWVSTTLVVGVILDPTSHTDRVGIFTVPEGWTRAR